MKIIKSKFTVNPTIYSILIILVLSFNSISIAFAQSKTDEPKITEAERKEAKEIVIKFALQFSKTKDITPLIKKFYHDDLIKQFKKFTVGELDKKFANGKLDEEDVKNVSIMDPFPIKANYHLLKQLNSEDWKRLFISINNCILSAIMFVEVKEHEAKKNEIDNLEKNLYSPKLKSIFKKNPNLVGLNEDGSESKPINSAEEFKNAIRDLNKATKVFNKDHKIFLTKKLARQIFESNENKKNYMMSLDIADEDYVLPKGTKVTFVEFPQMYYLLLAKKNNKLKIIFSALYVD